MHLILDAIVVAVILGCAIAAWRKGFIRAAFGFLPMLAALIGTNFVSPYVGRFLRGTFLFDSLSGSIRDSMGLDAAIQEGTMRTQTEMIEAMPLPEFLQEALLENNNPVIYQLLDVDSLKEYIAGFLANVCLNILSVVLAFLLIYIAVNIVLNALHLLSKFQVLSF
ncbi:MAG: CvpA family protein, partial [Anaerotignum sp.]|nr:CvpA family protein [Anaerotignum sp.]